MERDEDGATEVPGTAIEAAIQAFDEAYWDDSDELLSALKAATPRIRLDEGNRLCDRLRQAISEVPSGECQKAVQDGLRQALRLIETRERDLEAAS
jgi:hypothetical protein